MPITKSAAKRMRSDKRKHERNRTTLGRLKTLSKKFAALVTENNTEEAKKEGLQLMKLFDKAASRNIIPKRRADRKKSRVSRALYKLSGANTD